jgi:hypothetical protein
MPKQQKRWVWVKALTVEEKATIGLACERFVAEVLKPRFLPQIHPTSFNYPVNISSKWRGSKYGFITRFRSGFPENAGEEFDAAFARFDHVEECLTEIRFDVMWRRHTGQWWRVHSAATLDEALHILETEPCLRPPI